MNDIEVYERALRRYGIKQQLVMLMEECSELSKECSKIYRALEGEKCFTLDPMAEEIADVQVMCGQIQAFFDLKDSVKGYRKEKIRRLRNRLDAEERKPE